MRVVAKGGRLASRQRSPPPDVAGCHDTAIVMFTLLVMSAVLEAPCEDDNEG